MPRRSSRNPPAAVPEGERRVTRRSLQPPEKPETPVKKDKPSRSSTRTSRSASSSPAPKAQARGRSQGGRKGKKTEEEPKEEEQELEEAELDNEASGDTPKATAKGRRKGRQSSSASKTRGRPKAKKEELDDEEEKGDDAEEEVEESKVQEETSEDPSPKGRSRRSAGTSPAKATTPAPAKGRSPRTRSPRALPPESPSRRSGRSRKSAASAEPEEDTPSKDTKKESTESSETTGHKRKRDMEDEEIETTEKKQKTDTKPPEKVQTEEPMEEEQIEPAVTKEETSKKLKEDPLQEQVDKEDKKLVESMETTSDSSSPVKAKKAAESETTAHPTVADELSKESSNKVVILEPEKEAKSITETEDMDTTAAPEKDELPKAEPDMTEYVMVNKDDIPEANSEEVAKCLPKEPANTKPDDVNHTKNADQPTNSVPNSITGADNQKEGVATSQAVSVIKEPGTTQSENLAEVAEPKSPEKLSELKPDTPEIPAKQDKPDMPDSLEMQEDQAPAEKSEDKVQLEKDETPDDVDDVHDPEPPPESDETETPAEIDEPQTAAQIDNPESPAEIGEPKDPTEIGKPEATHTDGSEASSEIEPESSANIDKPETSPPDDLETPGQEADPAPPVLEKPEAPVYSDKLDTPAEQNAEMSDSVHSAPTQNGGDDQDLSDNISKDSISAPDLHSNISTTAPSNNINSVTAQETGATVPDPLFHRQYTANQNVDSNLAADKSREFGIVSYNILADCSAPLSDYPWISAEHLSQEYRHKRLLQELQYLNSDIICLQEVGTEYFGNTLKPTLRALGFEGNFIKRVSDQKNEGEATFYRTTRFSLVSSKGIPLRDLAFKELQGSGLDGEKFAAVKQFVDKPSVVLITQLRCTNTGKLLTVANIHVSWENLAKPDLQCIEVSNALKELVATATPQGAFVLCGDFNAWPGTPVYQLTKEGYLNDQSMSELQGVNNVRMTDGSVTSLVNLWWKGFQHTATNMKSAYYTVLGKEPLSIRFPHNGLVKPVDFVWYSGNILETSGVLETVDADNLPTIPNSTFPSDHISLKANLFFKC